MRNWICLGINSVLVGRVGCVVDFLMKVYKALSASLGDMPSLAVVMEQRRRENHQTFAGPKNYGQGNADFFFVPIHYVPTMAVGNMMHDHFVGIEDRLFGLRRGVVAVMCLGLVIFLSYSGCHAVITRRLRV